jgi:hypothetical protein
MTARDPFKEWPGYRAVFTSPRRFTTWWYSEFQRGRVEGTQRLEDARAGLDPAQSPEHARIRQAWRDTGLLTPQRDTDRPRGSTR